MKIRILVPTNFSEKSELALDYALRLSSLGPSEVYIFHVFERSRGTFSRVDELNRDSMAQMKRLVNEAIDRVHSQGSAHWVEEVHRRVATGRAPDEIRKMAEGICADWVVMGAPPSRRFRKFALNAPCTLVLVKDKTAI